MLLKVIRRLMGGAAAQVQHTVSDADLLEKGTELMMAGDNRGAIQAYRQYLQGDPYNVRALNDLGACLAETGDIANAVASFELAYSLDDGFIPAMVNHAKLLNDEHRGAEALAHLKRAKICNPHFLHTDAVYAGLLLKIGDTARARAFQFKSWMANFDNLRAANSHLFWMGYDDISDAELAMEHRFWAETLKPLPEPDGEAPDWTPRPLAAGRRIRLGYWSADLRNHSVRYFFRPLLEAHDRERFEIFLFHDFPGSDDQTEKIRGFADHFHEVHEYNDTQLRDFIRSQQLDLLVDLAGHTSHNRVSLLKSRMAPVQMNALGYPPTTGLPTVDAKLVDRHVLTPQSPQFYSERPLALPDSFWCFDPMEEAPIADEPPQVANGHVTFGAVGNIAKITERVAQAWTRILAAVPGSRLLLRSVSFTDIMAAQATHERLAGWGLPMDRIDFHGPQGGAAFFGSYNEVDIILDTFPFNGGTTTCFCTYMGVPLVTIAGQSLISRMGLSILANLGAPELAVSDVDAYVAKAVELAGDREFVRRFKKQARATYQGTPLGNGQLFAAQFEQACIELLQERQQGPIDRGSRIAALPAAEIIRRAYAAMRSGQPEAAQRIIGHCLHEYPDAGEAHLLHAQVLVWAGLVPDAIVYVRERLERFTPRDQVSAWISLARMHLLQQDRTAALHAIGQLRALPAADDFDQAQVALYQACLAADPAMVAPAAAAGAQPDARRMHFLVPCNSRPQFENLRDHIEEHCTCPPGWTLSFQRCHEDQRVAAYAAALADTGVQALVLVQKNVRISQPLFVEEVSRALEQADCISCGGALRWDRLDWRTDDFEQKAGGFMSPSSEKKELLELHLLGPGRQVLVPQAAILDGILLVARPGAAPAPPFDGLLLGCETLMEEAWSHAAGRQGWRLAVHRNLGVSLEAEVELDQCNRVEARLRCNEQQGFDPFGRLKDDHASLSAPVPDAATAITACGLYFTDAA